MDYYNVPIKIIYDLKCQKCFNEFTLKQLIDRKSFISPDTIFRMDLEKKFSCPFCHKKQLLSKFEFINGIPLDWANILKKK